jgi:hypothetical protein
MSGSVPDKVAPIDVPEFSLRTCKARLAQKLDQILSEIEAVPKSGRNKDQGYDYVRASDIVAATRKVFAKHGVFLKWVPRPDVQWREYMSRNNNLQREATIWYDAIFMDAETGYEEAIPWPGVGSDSGDKNLAKAATSALKSFLSTQFQIPDNGADGDHDDAAGDRGQARSQPRGSQQRATSSAAPRHDTGKVTLIDPHPPKGIAITLTHPDKTFAVFWARSTDVQQQLADTLNKTVCFQSAERIVPATAEKKASKFAEVVRVISVDGKSPIVTAPARQDGQNSAPALHTASKAPSDAAKVATSATSDPGASQAQTATAESINDEFERTFPIAAPASASLSPTGLFKA